MNFRCESQPRAWSPCAIGPAGAMADLTTFGRRPDPWLSALLPCNPAISLVKSASDSAIRFLARPNPFHPRTIAAPSRPTCVARSGASPLRQHTSRAVALQGVVAATEKNNEEAYEACCTLLLSRTAAALSDQSGHAGQPWGLGLLEVSHPADTREVWAEETGLSCAAIHVTPL